MITGIIFSVYVGCIVLYNTSQKAVLNTQYAIEKWIQSNRQKAKLIGVSILILTLVAANIVLGVTSGILFWLIALMSVLSLLVVISPLRIVNYKYLLLIFIGSLLIEIFIK